MAKDKSNPQLAAEFIAYLDEQGLDIWKETHPVGVDGIGQHEFLYILPTGTHGGNTSFTQLCQRVLLWLQESEIVKSPQQVKNIAKVVALNVENRHPNPHG